MLDSVPKAHMIRSLTILKVSIHSLMGRKSVMTNTLCAGKGHDCTCHSNSPHRQVPGRRDSSRACKMDAGIRRYDGMVLEKQADSGLDF